MDERTSAQSLSHELGNFIHKTRYEDLTPQTVQICKDRLLDCIATAITSQKLSVPSIARKFCQTTHGGSSSIIGLDKPVSAIDAAFVNAVLINGTTHDDFLEKSHVGAVTIPAALAVGEEMGSHGKDVLTSIALGYELVARVFLGGPTMLPRFRASGVAGVFGGATASSKLMNLSSMEIQNALGLAAMFASGFGEGFHTGTMDVKLNVGWASRSGVSAAQLAKLGANSAASIFEGESGFFKAFSNANENSGFMVQDLGKRFMIDDTVYKERPVCIFVQTHVGLAIELLQQHQFDAKWIEKITIEVPEATLSNPGFKNVAPFISPLKARISAGFTIAAALLNRPVDSYEYYENTGDAEVLGLATKVALSCHDKDEGDLVKVTIDYQGKTFTASGREMDNLKPSHKKVLSKFDRLTQHIDTPKREQILEALSTFENLENIKNLASVLRSI